MRSSGVPMPEIPDLQKEVIARAIRALEDQLPEPLYAEIVALAGNGHFLDNGALHELLARAAGRDLTRAD